MANSEGTSRIRLAAIILGGIVVIGIVILLFLPQTGGSSLRSQDNLCRVNESGMLVDPCIPLFKINNGTNDTISAGDDGPSWDPAPPTNESQRYIDKALEPYGGVPKDAVLSSVDVMEWSGTYNSTSGIETQWATKWCAKYTQFLYEKPIIGYGGSLSVCIINGGKPSSISKHWMSVEEVGMERVIPASEAIERLKNHEGRFNPPTRTLIYDYIPDAAFNLTIKEMELRYFVSDNSTNETYLEPVWRISTIDNIRHMPFIFYIPAGYQPAQYTHPNSDLFGNPRNFSQIKGSMPVSDISLPQTVLIGTTGPLGKNAAEESVRKFIENEEINLTYNGRYRSSSSVCNGGYQGEYYSFNTTDCQFQVDTYSGVIISASLNKSCVKPDFSGKTSLGNLTKDEATSLADRFAREKYSFFDEKHMSRDSSFFKKFKEGDYYGISYTGDFGTISESGMYINVRYRDGLITSYSVKDDDLEYLCGGEEGAVKINE